MRQRSSNLPNMFQQQEKREQELLKQRQLGAAAAKESIPTDKKIFTNFLDKFEDENSRQGCQMAIARFLDRMCLALRASGLWLRYATL